MIVLLFSSIILISMLSSSFFSSLGSRMGTANERTAYQALLGAESGLDTFATRYDLAPIAVKPIFTFPARPTGTTAENTSDISLDNNFAVFTIPDSSVRVTLTAKAVTTLANVNYVRVTSKAEIRSGNETVAQKTAVRDFQAASLTGTYGDSPAAFTSFNSITATGNASIMGYNTNQRVAMVNASPNPVTNTTANTIQVNYTDDTTAANMDVGDPLEVTISGTDYRFSVSAITATQVTLKLNSPAISVSSLPTLASQDIRRGPAYVLTQALSVTSGTVSSNIFLNSTNGLRVDQDGIVVGGVTYNNAQRITIFDGTTIRTGKITDINGNTISVTWEPTPSTAFSVAQDKRLDTTIPSLASRYNVSVTGSATAPDVIRYSTWFPSRETMFESFFGVTKAQMQASSSVTVVSPGAFNQNMNVYTNKIVYVTGDLTNSNKISGGSGLCGTNYILIVDGDIDINQSDNCFKGLIYITGKFGFSGNPSIVGSIVVEGDPPPNGTVDSDGEAITITGTGGKTFKVSYSPYLMSTISTYIPTSSFALTPTSSWRQPQ